MQELTISQILLDEALWKSRVAIRAIVIKTTTGMSFWASVVECESHCSYLIEQYTGLNCISSDSYGNWAPETNLALLHFSRIPYRVHAIHIQYCWYLQYWIFRHPILKQLSFLHLLSICFENSHSDWKHVGKMLCEVLWISWVQFWNYVPLKVVPHFLDHPINTISICISICIAAVVLHVNLQTW